MAKLRLRKLVDTEEAMKKFIVDYRIPPNVSLRHCKMGEWYYKRETGEVVIPVLAFVEGGMRIPMGPVTKGYLRHFRLAPTQCTGNMFRILGCVDALNEKMGAKIDPPRCKLVLQSPKFEGEILLHEDERRKGLTNPMPPRFQQGVKQGFPYRLP